MKEEPTKESNVFFKDCPGEQIGKVFSTNCFVTTCQCGRNVSQLRYMNKENQKPEKIDIFLGVCKCGNVYIAQNEQL